MTPDEWQNLHEEPLDPDVFGSGLLSDTIDAYRDEVAWLKERIRDLEAQLAQAKARHEQPERDYSWGSHP